MTASACELLNNPDDKNFELISDGVETNATRILLTLRERHCDNAWIIRKLSTCLFFSLLLDLAEWCVGGFRSVLMKKSATDNCQSSIMIFLMVAFYFLLDVWHFLERKKNPFQFWVCIHYILVHLRFRMLVWIRNLNYINGAICSLYLSWTLTN